MPIQSVDHIVMTVRDIESTCDFYANVLELPVITFGNGRKALQVGTQKINLHSYCQEFEPKAQQPTPGAG
jgi:catechol 2,3-dioxygenase-like lactoylglutathione lyase family enzyme